MEKLIDFIKKKFWPMIGVISTIFGVIGGYSYFFEKNKTSLEYQIVNHVSALDVKENLSKLDITYNGKNLKDNNENIQIFTVRLINTGNQIIKENDYGSENFGLKIHNGIFIEKPKVIATSNYYLKNNAKLIMVGSNQIILPKLIIEPNESFEFKIYVLFNEKSLLSLESIGKIAGIKEGVQIIEGTKSEAEPFLKKGLSGGIAIQLFRLFIYGFILIGVLILMLFIVYYLEKYSQKRKRKLKVKEFKKVNSRKPIDEPIFQKYIESTDSMYSPTFYSFVGLKYSPEKLKSIYDGNGKKDKITEPLFEKDDFTKKQVEDLLELGIIDEEFNLIKGRKEFLLNFMEFIYNIK